MKRQAIGDGHWFDLDAAEQIGEGTRFDGRNHVSLATGGQWEHESLYVTRTGRFVLNHWSQWVGSPETWEEITPKEAAAWLVRCEKDAAELPEAAARLIVAEYEATEI